MSTGEPTYWPSDQNKIPDLIDFFVYKGISDKLLEAKSNLDLSSDHTPVILTVLFSHILDMPSNPTLHNKHTQWDYFREYFENQLKSNLRLKNGIEIDNAIENLTNAIQKAAWESTPAIKISNSVSYPKFILNMVAKKRLLRRAWQNSRHPEDKRALNAASRKLNRMIKIFKNNEMKTKLQNLSNKAETNYSLWKITKKLTRPINHQPPIRMSNNKWARTSKEKVEAFAGYFSSIFQPIHTSWQSSFDTSSCEIENIDQFCLKFFNMKEVKEIIKKSESQQIPWL